MAPVPGADRARKSYGHAPVLRQRCLACPAGHITPARVHHCRKATSFARKGKHHFEPWMGERKKAPDGVFFLSPQTGLEPVTLRLTAGCSTIELLRITYGVDGTHLPLFEWKNRGGGNRLSPPGFLCVDVYLSSRHVAMQVLSARQSLTSVFGMGTGGPSALLTSTLHLQGFEPGTH